MRQKKLYIGSIFLAFFLFFANFVVAQTTEDNNMEKDNKATTVAGTENTDGVLVEFKTTMGDIEVLLYNDTPLHRDNFIKLVNEGYYDGLLFHRVIDNFMIQTGDPDSKNAEPGKMLGAGSPNYTIEAEIEYPKHYNKYGALAAARTGDQVNPERRSSGSQFYIVTGRKMSEQQFDAMMMRQHQEQLQNTFQHLSMQYRDSIVNMQKAGDQDGLEKLRQELIKETEAKVGNQVVPENIKTDYTTIGGAPHLDGAYTVFGEVVKGMDIVEKIQKVETDSHDRPLEDVRIISAKVIKNN